MNTRLRHLWDVLDTSYWFIPSVMTIAAIALAFAMVGVDREIDHTQLEGLRVVYYGGPEGARALLSTVAASIITVAGVVFSITIAALTQASGQFGPRLLRNFMRDTGNQIVLGTFVATFIYCLLVLRTVYGVEERAFVPHVSVTVALVMAVASLGVLIYFVHHVSASLQAPVVAANVARDLHAAIKDVYAANNGDGGGDGDADAGGDAEPVEPLGSPTCACARRPGYLLAVNEERLVAEARNLGLLVRMRVRAGDFLTTGRTIAEIFAVEREPHATDGLIDKALLIGESRTSEQDVEFAIDQLVEIAVRALSPGINDPFTAVHCVDWLGEALSEIARQPTPSPYRRDDEGVVRLIADLSTFDGLTDAAFDQIRQYGRNSVSVTVRLLEAITCVAQSARTAEQRRSLLRHAEMIHRQASTCFTEAHDLRSVEARFEAAQEALVLTEHG